MRCRLLVVLGLAPFDAPFVVVAPFDPFGVAVGAAAADAVVVVVMVAVVDWAVLVDDVAVVVDASLDMAADGSFDLGSLQSTGLVVFAAPQSTMVLMMRTRLMMVVVSVASMSVILAHVEPVVKWGSGVGLIEVIVLA
jgi:hypothetical protein